MCVCVYIYVCVCMLCIVYDIVSIPPSIIHQYLYPVISLHKSIFVSNNIPIISDMIFSTKNRYLISDIHNNNNNISKLHKGIWFIVYVCVCVCIGEFMWIFLCVCLCTCISMCVFVFL